MRRVAILGAAGRLGQKLVARALVKGFEVHAIARNPAALKSANYRLTTFKADLGPGTLFGELMERCDYVIWALAGEPVKAQLMSNLLSHFQNVANDTAFPNLQLEEVEGTAHLLLKRIVYISQRVADIDAGQSRAWFGIGASLKKRSRLARIEDETRAEALLRESRLPFIILRPTQLNDSFLSGTVIPADEAKGPLRPASRSNLAKFVFDILEQSDWNAREVTVGEGQGE